MLPLGSISLTSDCRLIQHQITSDFYAPVSYNLNASFNKPNKENVPSLNPKQSELVPLNGEVVYNLRNMLVSLSTKRRELLSFETLTKHTLGWEIDEKNLKIMNLTYFRHKMRENVKKTTQWTLDLSPKHQASEMYLRTSLLISC